MTDPRALCLVLTTQLLPDLPTLPRGGWATVRGWVQSGEPSARWPTSPELREVLVARLAQADRILEAVQDYASAGVWAVTEFDTEYPEAYRARFGPSAPPVLFGWGEQEWPESGLAVAGSRDASPDALAMAAGLGEEAASRGDALISGGARGVDRAAEQAALLAGGRVVSVLAENLLRATRDPEAQARAESGQLTLVTPFSPKAPFSAGNAMGRNRLIYGLATRAAIVACTAEKGGTWAGAVQAIAGRICPVFCWVGPGAPSDNQKLVRQGAHPFETRKGPWDAPPIAEQGTLF